MSKNTITLYTMSWGGYWDRYGKTWSEYINKLNTRPDEIIIVSDEPLDMSTISITDNIKNVVVQSLPGQSNVSHYRNTAIENSSSEWVVASDIDDIPFENYLDNLDDSSDIHAFSFIDENDKKFISNADSLKDRAYLDFKTNLIPGTSAIKKSFFKNIRYENDCYEDRTFYAMAYFLNPKVSVDESIRFKYSGWNSYNKRSQETSEMYDSLLSKDGRHIFVCWFSDTISDNRKNALKILAKKSGVGLKLVTKNSFYSYENSELPIHSGFEYLSDVHKSDYARAYLMYFHGGGYSDIKANSFDWNQYFDKLMSSRYDAIGTAESRFEWVANFWNDDKDIEEFVRSRYNDFAAMSHFIFKPRTRFAYDWITNIHKLMDDNYEQLKENPGLHPYAVRGGIHESYTGYVSPEQININYPFNWSDIGGTTRHRLEYEHGLNVFKKGMPLPNMTDYR